MNYWLLGSGIVTALTALMHLVGGGRDVLRPLFATDLGEVPRRTLQVGWYLIAFDLASSAVALLLLGAGVLHASPWLPRFIALRFGGYGLLFVAVALLARVPRGLIQLGQWLLFVPLAAAIWLGS